MTIDLEHPVYLWILVAAIPLLAFAAYKSYAIAPRWKRWWSFGLRVVGVACLVLALCRPVLRLEKPDQAVVFAIDVSDSVAHEVVAKAAERIVEASKALEEHQRVAVVAFAGKPRVVRSLSADPVEIPIEEDASSDAEGASSDAQAEAAKIADALFHRRRKETVQAEILALERDMSGDGAVDKLEAARARLRTAEAIEAELETGETNLRDALRLARSLLPDDARRRVVLFSDGNWTRHDPEPELALLARAEIPVDTVVLPHAEEAEVVAERLVAPGEVRIREPVELELRVNATAARDVEVKLFRDGYLLKTETVTLEKGRNVVQIPKQELEEGFHEFRAVVVADGDPRPENNVARAVVVVTGRPKVLLVEGDERDARPLEQSLRDEEVAVEVRPPIGFPESLNDLLAYDVLIMSDVAATDLHSTQLGLVKRYVRDFGGGLIMIGGERSFGLGGYYRTPVEDALPVRMPIKKTIEKPSLGLVLVLDRSGSMAGEKVALAKEAAIAAVEVLKKKDMVGIVGFDSVAEWVVELQPAANKDNIVTLVSQIAPGGGTDIYAGMYRAFESLRESTAKLKHVILLSDGHTSGSRDECVDIVDVMSSEQITVSTVGIGEADQPLLERMADRGQGESYFTNDFGNIPQIFTKETLRASKSMLVEEPFVPARTGIQHQMLDGLDFESAPLLYGYIATTPKERARLLLVSDYGEPILAHWNYGLGASVAFTSDAKTRWAPDWIGWEQFGKFWAQVIRSVMSTGTTSFLQQTADIRVERGGVKIRVDSRDRAGRFLDIVEPAVSIVGTGGDVRPIEAAHVAPGLYEAEFPIESYGDFVRLRVETKDMATGDAVGLRRYAVVESYPPEYRAATEDRDFLEHVADATGGRREPGAAEAVAFDGPPARGLRDLWRLLVLIAGILLPLDIALRRLG